MGFPDPPARPFLEASAGELGTSSADHKDKEKVIVFQDIHLAFDQHKVLQGISFEVSRGETKVIFGAAGSGKSVILKLTLGLIKPDRGRILVLGEEVTAMTEEQLFELRRKIGMVFQESALFDSQTVEENVAFRLIEEHMPPQQIHDKVAEALRFVELEHTLEKLPAELSGGMRRRVAIARAMISQPEILLYDSPTAGLDPITSTTIVALLVKQRDVYHTTALLVTHRLQDAFLMASHRFDKEKNQMERLKGARTDLHTTFLVLRDGKIIFDGTAPEMTHSRDEYIKEYIS